MENKLKRLSSLSFILLFLGITNLYATSKNSSYDESVVSFGVSDTLSADLNKYLFVRLNMQLDTPRVDTISYLYNQYIGELDYLNDESVPMRYIAPNPFYYRLQLPLAYYNSPIKQIKLPELEPYNPVKQPEWQKNIPPLELERWKELDRANKLVDRALLTMYLNDISLAITTEDRIMGQKIYFSEVEKDKEIPKKTATPFFKADEDLKEDLSMVKNLIKKPNWWLTGGDGSLQLTQNYISENWYKGGESTNSMLASLRLFANYNDREKVQFENLAEAKFGFNTASSDSIRKYRINTDLIRLTSKLGLQAAKKWYYTLAAEINTQFSPSYKKNSTDVVSAFLSPMNFIVSLGMDYKLEKPKVKLSLMLLPADYNLRYVRRKDVDETQFGVDEGKAVRHEVGSRLKYIMEWKIINTVTWSTRLEYFTSYDKVEAEWENTFNFILNRYLSTKIFVHARFDDNVNKLPGKSYFQLKELLSFGINYKW